MIDSKEIYVRYMVSEKCIPKLTNGLGPLISQNSATSMKSESMQAESDGHGSGTEYGGSSSIGSENDLSCSA